MKTRSASHPTKCRASRSRQERFFRPRRGSSDPQICSAAEFSHGLAGSGCVRTSAVRRVNANDGFRARRSEREEPAVDPLRTVRPPISQAESGRSTLEGPTAHRPRHRCRRTLRGNSYAKRFECLESGRRGTAKPGCHAVARAAGLARRQGTHASGLPARSNCSDATAAGARRRPAKCPGRRRPSRWHPARPGVDARDGAEEHQGTEVGAVLAGVQVVDPPKVHSVLRQVGRIHAGRVIEAARLGNAAGPVRAGTHRLPE